MSEEYPSKAAKSGQKCREFMRMSFKKSKGIYDESDPSYIEKKRQAVQATAESFLEGGHETMESALESAEDFVEDMETRRNMSLEERTEEALNQYASDLDEDSREEAYELMNELGLSENESLSALAEIEQFAQVDANIGGYNIFAGDYQLEVEFE